MLKEMIVHLLTVLDGETEELLDLVELYNFKLDEFVEQFAVDPEDDPQMHGRYAVGPDDVAFLRHVTGMDLKFDFQNFAYFIEAAKKSL